MIKLNKKQRIILAYLDGDSNRQIAKNIGCDKNTVNKYVNEYEKKLGALLERDPQADPSVLIEDFVEPPTYNTQNRGHKPTTEMAIKLIQECLEENDRKRLNGRGKQQMRATDIHYYLTHTYGLEISYSTVKRLKHELDDKANEAFIRQEYNPGQICEFDWGEVKLNIGGRGHHKYQMAAFASAYGNYRYAVLFRSQDTAAFQESHVKFFQFCHGVYHTVVYDNMKVAVKTFVGPSEKEPTDALIQLSLYYGFNYKFCNVRRGNEKPHVERTVDVMRHFAFSEPGSDTFDSLEDANDHLLRKCIEKNHLALSDGRIPADTFEEERPCLMREMPPLPCFVKRVGCRVDKYSTAAANNVRYSVPEKYTGKRVDARIYTGKVVFYDGDTVIAEHARSFDQGSYHLNIFHYLKTLKRKPGALSQSTALLQADTLIKNIYERYYSKDPKTFLSVLDLIHDHGAETVNVAIEQLLKITPIDMGADKLKAVIEHVNTETVLSDNQNTATLDKVIKSKLIQYDRLMQVMNGSDGRAV